MGAGETSWLSLREVESQQLLQLEKTYYRKKMLGTREHVDKFN